MSVGLLCVHMSVIYRPLFPIVSVAVAGLI